MRTEDGYIIQKCLNGDPSAFGFLVDKYKAAVYALAYSRLGNFHDAEDLTQEVFIKAYQNLRKLRRWDSFLAWLYSITANLCKNWIRDRSRRPDSKFAEDEEPEALAEASVNSYSAWIEYESLNEAMDSLPEMYSQVLTLHYLGGMSCEEIARFVGASPDAIRKRLSKARSLLKEEMIAMMNAEFEEQRLKATFTFRIVEAAKRMRIMPEPRMNGLPYGLSLTAGLIFMILSFGSHFNIPYPLVAPVGLTSPAETAMTETGDLPVDFLEVPQVPYDTGSQIYSRGGGYELSDQQDAILMAPRGEGGKFPEKPSGRLGNGNARGIAYSPDGKILAVASGSGIWLYDADNLNAITHIQGTYYHKIAFSPDGKLMALLSVENEIHLWDVNEQKQVGILKGQPDHIYCIVFSPDGKILASGDSGKAIRLWDVNEQKQTGLLKATGLVRTIAFSSDGKTLASGSENKTIHLWDVKEQKQIGLLQGHTDAVLSLAFSTDDSILASGSWDKTIRLWDVKEQKQLGILQGHTDAIYINSIIFSPDREILFSGSLDKTIRLWDFKAQKQVGVLKEGANEVWQMVLSPDGKTLASLESDYVIRLWDVDDQKQKGSIEGFTDVNSLAFSPNGKMLVSGGYTRLRLWDIQGQKQIGLLEGFGFNTGWTGPGVIFTPDGRTMASIVWKEIYLFDVQEQKQIGTLKGHTEYITSIAFTPDGKILASSGNRDQTVRLWDVAKQKEIGVLMNGSWTHCLAISPDGETVAVSVGAERLVRLWDIKTQKEIGVLPDATCAAFSVAISLDGKTVASGNQCGAIWLWDMKSRKQVGVLQGPVVSGMKETFSPDGKWLVSVGGYNANGNIDNTARIWDVQEQKQIATIEGHADNKVNSVAFSPDGKWMASVGEDGVILLWEVNIPVQGKAVEPTGKLPGTWGEVKKASLFQNFPNPFNPETWIPYQLSESADVSITIRDPSARLVRVLSLGRKDAGSYLAKEKAAFWGGENEAGEPVASGVYFYTMQAGSFVSTRKMVVTR